MINIIQILAALITILLFIVQFATGKPFRRLLWWWSHRIDEISSPPDFTIERITTRSGQILNRGDTFSYKFETPLDVSGRTSLSKDSRLWVVVIDQFGGYFLQSPPVAFIDSQWRSYNLRPMREIRRILWVSVDYNGDALFQRKVKEGAFGRFDALPDGTKELAQILLTP